SLRGDRHGRLGSADLRPHRRPAAPQPDLGTLQRPDAEPGTPAGAGHVGARLHDRFRDGQEGVPDGIPEERELGSRRRSLRSRGGARAGRVRDGWGRRAACLFLPLVAAAALACRKTPAAFASIGTPQPETLSRAPAREPAGAGTAGYRFTAAERAAVEGFLTRHPGLRVASDQDRRPSDIDDVQGLYGVYHPYFVRGDINDDGVLDFVLAFV